jgi:hypothetical protein
MSREVRTELDHAATGQACTGEGCFLFAQEETGTTQDGQQQINVRNPLLHHEFLYAKEIACRFRLSWRNV